MEDSPLVVLRRAGVQAVARKGHVRDGRVAIATVAAWSLDLVAVAGQPDDQLRRERVACLVANPELCNRGEVPTEPCERDVQ